MVVSVCVSVSHYTFTVTICMKCKNTHFTRMFAKFIRLILLHCKREREKKIVRIFSKRGRNVVAETTENSELKHHSHVKIQMEKNKHVRMYCIPLGIITVFDWNLQDMIFFGCASFFSTFIYDQCCHCCRCQTMLLQDLYVLSIKIILQAVKMLGHFLCIFWTFLEWLFSFVI